MKNRISLFLLSLIAFAQVLCAAPGDITTPRYSKLIVYASQVGVPVDSDRDTGGGSDATAALNTALAAIGNAGGGELDVDGAVRITAPLEIWSHTTLRFVGKKSGVFLSGSANCVMLRNKHRSTSTRTDSDIEIDGGYWNGNGDNQTLTSGTSVLWNTGFRFTGVAGLKIHDTEIHDSKTFAYHLNNISDYTVRSVRATWTNPFASNSDGVHLNGPCERGVITEVYSNGDDDTVGINCDEIGDTAVEDNSTGNIVDLFADNITNDSPQSLRCIRVLRQHVSPDRIIIGKCTSRSRDALIMLEGQGLTETGTGGNIIFKGPLICTATNAALLNQTWIDCRTSWKSLSFEDVVINGAPDNRPVLFVGVSGTTNNPQIGLLSIKGLKKQDLAGQTANAAMTAAFGSSAVIIQQGGNIQRVSVSDTEIQRDPSLARIPFFLINQGTVGSVRINGFAGNQLDGIVQFQGNFGPTVGGITACNIVDVDEPNGLFQVFNQAIPYLVGSNIAPGSPLTYTASGGSFTAVSGDAAP